MSLTDVDDFSNFLTEVGVSPEVLEEAYKLVPEPLSKNAGDPYIVALSPIHGKGVFSTANLEAGCAVGLFRVEEEWTEVGRYANHSPTPNLEVHIAGPNMYATAKCDVQAGEELVVDYRNVRDCLKLQNLGVVVVDNFCDQVELVRESLLEAGTGTWLPNKGAVGSSVYDGMGFWGDHVYMLRSLVAATGHVVLPNVMFFRVTNVGMEKAYIHSDRGSGAHTCIAYMSKHEDGTSGTAFYRHIPTGLTTMPSFEEMQELGIFEELSADMVSRDPSKWEQIAFVEGRYNRAVIFEAPLFHSRFPVEGIGHGEEDGRLIWASHFYKLNGLGELS